MSAFEVIERSRRYILGEGEESYGIWDRRGRDEPLERFPFTAEGFDAAQARFAELKRLDRRARDVASKVIAVVALVGVVSWVLAVFLTGSLATFILGGAAYDTAGEVALAAETVAFRLALGGLIALGVLAALRWRESAGPAPAAETAERGRLDRALVVLAVVAVTLWALSALATRMLEPHGVPLPFRRQRTPGTAYLVAFFVESLAFRVWVAAVVIFGLRRFGPRPAAA